MPTDAKLLGRRIRGARERLGISQQDLATQSGFSHHQTISKIEIGERELKAWELAKIVQSLKVSIHQLLGSTFENEEPKLLWRVTPAEPQSVTTEFLAKCSDYKALEDLFGEAPARSLPTYKIDFKNYSYLKAERLGSAVRNTLNLGSKPAKGLRSTLEDEYGCKIWFLELEEGSGACICSREFGIGILINASEPPWRRNFSLAHELFHVLTWECIQPNEEVSDEGWLDIERYANAFASSLLLPSEAFVTELDEHSVGGGSITYGSLVSLAREFDVSSEAFLWRMVNLKMIARDELERIRDDNRFAKVDRMSMSAVSWEEPTPLPERFMRLAIKAYCSGKLSKSKLAKYFDWELDNLIDYLEDNEYDNIPFNVAVGSS